MLEFLRAEDGTTAIEYCLLSVILGTFLLAAFQYLGFSVASLYAFAATIVAAMA